MVFSERLCSLVNSSITASMGSGKLLDDYGWSASVRPLCSLLCHCFGWRTRRETKFYLCICVCVCMCISVCIRICWLINPLHPECNCILNSSITTREWFSVTSWVGAFGKNGIFFFYILLNKKTHRFFMLKKWLDSN